jgi:L-arabinose transport system substrate-binding protein
MKRILGLVLSVVVAVGLAFCMGCKKKGGEGTQGKIKIGFIVKQPEEPWFQNEWKFADQAAEKYGFELMKIGAADGDKALSAIDTLAANGAQGFVICTPDVKLGPAIVRKAKAHNMKLLSVDDRFENADGTPMENVHYLGISARKIGQAVGGHLYEQMQKRKWNVQETGVCVVTFDELETARERTEGAIEVLIREGFPEDRIFRTPEKKAEVEAAINATNALLTQHPEIKRWLVCSMNDNSVLGAVRALEGRGFNADTVIGIGINGTDCINEFQRAKPTGFWGSMLLSAKQHGYETAEMMYKWIADGIEPPLDTRTTGVLITRDTYKQIYKEQGLSD